MKQAANITAVDARDFIMNAQFNRLAAPRRLHADKPLLRVEKLLVHASEIHHETAAERQQLSYVTESTRKIDLQEL